MTFSEEFLNKIEYYECVFYMNHNRSESNYGVPFTKITLHFKSPFRRRKVISSEWMKISKNGNMVYEETNDIHSLRTQLGRWFGNQTMKTVNV